jgi:hypothetical protein
VIFSGRAAGLSLSREYNRTKMTIANIKAMADIGKINGVLGFPVSFMASSKDNTCENGHSKKCQNKKSRPVQEGFSETIVIEHNSNAGDKIIFIPYPVILFWRLLL